MNWPSVVCFGIVLAFLVSAFGRRADLFSPYRIFGVVWATAIGLVNLNFSFFQREWSGFAWINILVGAGSMMLGLFIASVITLDRRALSPAEIRAILARRSLHRERIFASILVLTALYAAGLAVEAVAEDGFPIFSGNPDRSRIEFGLFGIHLFVTLMPAILLLAAVYMIWFRKSGPRLWNAVVWLCALIVFFSFALLLQRFGYVMWAVSTLVVIYYGTGKLRAWHLGALGAVMIGFLQLLQSVRVARFVENYSWFISRLRFPKTYAMLAEPYMYIVMNLENFARSVDRWTSWSYGYFTFDFLLAATGLKHPIAADFGLVERPFLISGYNTFSFLMPFYQDFGIFGVAAVPLALGIGIGYLHHVVRTKPTVTALLAYGMAAYLLLISFFIHALGMLTVFSNILVLLGLSHFFLEKRDGPAGIDGRSSYPIPAP